MSARGGRHHLAWDSQPLLRSTARPRRFTGRAIVIAFLVGLLLGLVF